MGKPGQRQVKGLLSVMCSMLTAREPVCGRSLLCQMAEAEGFHAICRNRLGVPPITIILLNKTRIERQAEQHAADSPHH